MKQKKLRFRQIHLDFHTSPAIEGIGEAFDREQFQNALKAGHVDSITCFSSCHHGWSYHPTKVGKMHPHLTFDLLKAQMEACKAIDVKVPVYLTAGVDNVAAEENPGWREVNPAGTWAAWAQSPLKPGFKTLCFNSPYLDYLCAKIEEAVTLYPEADGIFLDIIHQSQCCCPWCMQIMKEKRLDPLVENDRIRCSMIGLEKYYQRTTAACKVQDPDMPVFHNSGNIYLGRRSVLPYFSHLELESLPTGGWGYDHFPFTAKYASSLGMDFLGMTGKFQTTWGEFGGFKHPNALRYECAAMIAYGAKCSIGDQLHPAGKMDESTYRIVGEAYKEVEAKEAWCRETKNMADIGLLTCTANHERQNGLWADGKKGTAPDTGASRILLEGHYLFDVLDDEMDFDKYKMLILPDEIIIDTFLKAKLDRYLLQGGKLFMTGDSGMGTQGEFLFDTGAEVGDINALAPGFIQPEPEFAAPFMTTPMVMYAPGRRLKAGTGKSLGKVWDPYFNRRYNHFCSHQHTPNQVLPTEYDCGVISGQTAYLPHKVFSQYYAYGAVVYKEFIIKALDALLGTGKSLQTSLPSSARIVVTGQPAEQRKIVHLLYANTITRGASMPQGFNEEDRRPNPVEIIEELLPLHNTTVTLKTEKPVKVLLEPQHEELAADYADGAVNFTIDTFECHQMVVLEYKE